MLTYERYYKALTGAPEFLSISYQAVSKWENGVTVPDLYLIPKLAEYFEVTIDELFAPNMKGYKNRAQRLLAMYEGGGRDEDFHRADSEYTKLFAGGQVDGEDMRLYGVLNEYRAYALAAKAEGLYRQAIAAGEDARPQLLYLLSKTSRNEENIASQEAALEAAPDDVQNWRLLANAYEYANLPEKALAVAEEGLTKFPGDARLLAQCGDSCRLLKQYDMAIDYHEAAIKSDPAQCGSYYSIAFIHQDTGAHRKALAAWEQVRDFCTERGMDVEAQWPINKIAKLREIAGE
ncbi:MAG: helix-turn-helix domain-containing protein [Defluviitaleaceae bacterium]|nr:helix-turn-helix domain-containing protein [Defluviitaleaceae bacterium]